MAQLMKELLLYTPGLVLISILIGIVTLALMVFQIITQRKRNREMNESLDRINQRVRQAGSVSTRSSDRITSGDEKPSPPREPKPQKKKPKPIDWEY